MAEVKQEPMQSIHLHKLGIITISFAKDKLEEELGIRRWGIRLEKIGRSWSLDIFWSAYKLSLL
jgi:hypothetical protein